MQQVVFAVFVGRHQSGIRIANKREFEIIPEDILLPGGGLMRQEITDLALFSNGVFVIHHGVYLVGCVHKIRQIRVFFRGERLKSIIGQQDVADIGSSTFRIVNENGFFLVMDKYHVVDGIYSSVFIFLSSTLVKKYIQGK